MGKVSADISMSLDGYIAGPNESVESPLGEGGEGLHQWLFDLTSWRAPHGLAGGESNRDSEILDEVFMNGGAVVMGRRMFDAGEAPWGDDPPFHNPVFVVTHRAREQVTKEGGTTFNFVTDGIDSAVKQAKEAAGEKDVLVAGGADIIQRSLSAGLLDELQIHLVPILLNGGRRLFDHEATGRKELKAVRVVDSPAVTHLKFQVV